MPLSLRTTAYDDSFAGCAIKARLRPENLMTPKRQNASDLAEIVQYQFGRRYDGSEARNKSSVFVLAQAKAPTGLQLTRCARAKLGFAGQ